MCFLSDIQEYPAAIRPKPRKFDDAGFKYAARLGVSRRAIRRVGVACLKRCKDDESRRLLLRGAIR